MLASFKLIRWKLVWFAFLGLAALVGLVLLMSLITKKDQVQTTTAMKVIIMGKESFIDQNDISNLINKEFGTVVGKPLNLVPLQEIEKSLEKLPYVSDVEVFSDMDGVIQVSIQQREVILRVINAFGKEYYVDSKGVKIPVTLRYVPHVLVANGNIAEGYTKPLEEIKTPLLKDLVNIVEQVKDDALWSNQIVQLYVNSEKDIEIVPRVGDQQLIIGNADSLTYKLERLQVFYKEILPRVGNDAYAKVNVKYGGQIICERRGDWFLDSLQLKINKSLVVN